MSIIQIVMAATAVAHPYPSPGVWASGETEDILKIGAPGNSATYYPRVGHPISGIIQTVGDGKGYVEFAGEKFWLFWDASGFNLKFVPPTGAEIQFYNFRKPFG